MSQVSGDRNLPVLFQYSQPTHNVAIYRGADLERAKAAGVLPGAGSGAPPTPVEVPVTTPAPPPPPPTTYAPAPPAPVAYQPAPLVYQPAPVVYRPAPAYPAPAPIVYRPAPAPVVYKPAPSYAEPAYNDVIIYFYNFFSNYYLNLKITNEQIPYFRRMPCIPGSML